MTAVNNPGYRAVDPENRLVAATLEKSWNDVLQKERQVQEEYDHFLRQSPPRLTDQERATIDALAQNIPALWHAPATTNWERKQILRCLINRVVVYVRCDSEHVAATIHWKGGSESHHEFIRPVKTYAQLRNYEALMARIATLREAGHAAAAIADAQLLAGPGPLLAEQFGELAGDRRPASVVGFGAGPVGGEGRPCPGPGTP